MGSGDVMTSNRLDEVRDYTFADRALALRQRAGLTQGELAALIGVGVRSVQAWEAALSYPVAERLQQLIALYLERGGFPAGREEEEATALWEAARTRAAAHRPIRPGPVCLAGERGQRQPLDGSPGRRR
jgi:transcriptional regulator with XRE-family HTH domain